MWKYVGFKQILFISLFYFVPQINAVSNIERKIEKEVLKELSVYKNKQKKLQKSLDGKVAKEIEWQRRKKLRKNIKNKREGNVKLHNVSRFRDGDFFYKIPKWPFSSLYYAERDLAEAHFIVDGASKAFRSNGSSQDITKLIFGEKDLVLKDILLASELLSQGVLDANSARKEDGSQTGPEFHFYNILKNQPLVFDGSTNSQRMSLNYARHFMDGDISFGFQIPIVRRRNNLKLKSDFSSDTREELNDVSPNFFELYDSLDSFIEAIINKRNMVYTRRSTETGLGDITAFINLEIPSKRLERLIIGSKALFPSSNDSRIGELWHADLGNGGFFEFTAFVGALKSINSVFNLHGFIEVTASPASKLSRRIPIRKVYEGNTPGQPVRDFLTLGSTEVQFTSQAFDEVDTLIRRFPGTSGTVKIHRGPQLFVRLGNIFEGVFDRKAFLDIYYDFRAKGANYIGQRAIDLFNPTVLKHNTAQIEHRVGFNYDYQFSGRKRFTIGMQSAIAGKNIPQTIQGDIALSLEF